MQTRKQKIEREIHILFIEKYLSLLIDAKKKSSLLPLSLKKVSFLKHLKEKNTAQQYIYILTYTLYITIRHISQLLFRGKSPGNVNAVCLGPLGPQQEGCRPLAGDQTGLLSSEAKGTLCGFLFFLLLMGRDIALLLLKPSASVQCNLTCSMAHNSTNLNQTAGL